MGNQFLGTQCLEVGIICSGAFGEPSETHRAFIPVGLLNKSEKSATSFDDVLLYEILHFVHVYYMAYSHHGMGCGSVWVEYLKNKNYSMTFSSRTRLVRDER